MNITIHTAIEIDHAETRSSIKLPRDVAEAIVKPIQATDDPLLAGPLGIGDVLTGTVDYTMLYQIREKAVAALAKELADHLLSQLRKRDTLNGWPVETESP